MSDDHDDSAAKSAEGSADPPRNFTLSINDRVRAMTIGAPAYATRKKHIEDLIARHIATLVALYEKRCASPGSRDHDHDAALLAKARSFDFGKLNGLIEAHNRYYPIEANLPTDLRTGEYLVYGRRWLPDEPWTAARFVEHALMVIAARAD